MDHPNACWDLGVELLRKGNELHLPLTIGQMAKNLTRTRIEGGKQIECTSAAILMLDTHRTIRKGRQRL